MEQLEFYLNDFSEPIFVDIINATPVIEEQEYDGTINVIQDEELDYTYYLLSEDGIYNEINLTDKQKTELCEEIKKYLEWQ